MVRARKEFRAGCDIGFNLLRRLSFLRAQNVKSTRRRGRPSFQNTKQSYSSKIQRQQQRSSLFHLLVFAQKQTGSVVRVNKQRDGQNHAGSVYILLFPEQTCKEDDEKMAKGKGDLERGTRGERNLIWKNPSQKDFIGSSLKVETMFRSPIAGKLKCARGNDHRPMQRGRSFQVMVLKYQ